MNDNVLENHEVYLIHQKNQCGSEGIGRYSCLKLVPIFIFARFWGMDSSEAIMNEAIPSIIPIFNFFDHL